MRADPAQHLPGSWPDFLAQLASSEAALRRTARRYSLCADDADDAYQRAVEILLTKAPPADLQRFVAWMQVVTRREALAVRRSRERLFGPPAEDHGKELDRIAGDEPDPQEWLERREQLANARRLLLELKPQERLALVLQAQGYSYAEIRRLCGWTYTKLERQPWRPWGSCSSRVAGRHGVSTALPLLVQRERLGSTTATPASRKCDVRDRRRPDGWRSGARANPAANTAAGLRR